MASMGRNDDAMAMHMKERMLDHDSISKAICVYKQKKEKSYDAEDIAEEYCEFMVLKVLSGDFSASSAKLSPGGMIDAFWHFHILDTAGYSAVFQAVCPPLGPENTRSGSKRKKQDPVASESEIVIVTINVKSLMERVSTVEVGADDTARHLKAIIQEQDGVPVDLQQIIFQGRQLEDAKTIDNCGIVDGSTVDGYYFDSVLYCIVLYC